MRFRLPTPQSHPGSSVRMPSLQAFQAHHSAWYRLQTCWGCTWCHYGRYNGKIVIFSSFVERGSMSSSCDWLLVIHYRLWINHSSFDPPPPHTIPCWWITKVIPASFSSSFSSSYPLSCHDHNKSQLVEAPQKQISKALAFWCSSGFTPEYEVAEDSWAEKP